MEGGHEKDEIIVELRSLLQHGVSALQGYCGGGSAETVALFRNEVEE